LALQTVSDLHSPLASYFPAPHVEQTRSDVGVGSTLSLSPALQVDHVVQAAALRLLLKLPASQGLQARSVVAVGGVETHVPAPHTLSGLQTRSVVAEGGEASYSISPQAVALPHTRSWLAWGGDFSVRAAARRRAAPARAEPTVRGPERAGFAAVSAGFCARARLVAGAATTAFALRVVSLRRAAYQQNPDRQPELEYASLSMIRRHE
jgi:hypothetical protein